MFHPIPAYGLRHRVPQTLRTLSIVLVASLLALLATVLVCIDCATADTGLTQEQTIYDGGLREVQTVAVSPDGAHVYAVCADRPNDQYIVTLERTAGTGVLSTTQIIEAEGGSILPALYDARALGVSVDGDNVYVGGSSFDIVAGFVRDSTTGVLTPSNKVLPGASGLDDPYAIAFSPDGYNVYITGEGSHSLAAFRRYGVAGLSPIDNEVDGQGGVTDLAGARGVVVSPDGKHVYATGYIDSAVNVFSRAVTGTLESGGTVTGTLTYVHRLKDGVEGVDGLYYASGIAISPDGAHVYVAGKYDHSVAVFSRDTISGTLTYVEHQKNGVGGVTGLHSVQDVTVSPDGSHVYAASSYTGNAVAVFARNSSTGALTFVEAKTDDSGGVDGLYGARSVIVSPDDNHVYVAGEYDDAVAAFSRNTTTGALSFVEAERHGLHGSVNALDGASDVALSLDAAHLYVAGKWDNSVSVWHCDSGSGTLTYVDAEREGRDGAEGLVDPKSVVVSPDGKHVYVVAGRDTPTFSVTAFARNASTGALSFVEANYDNNDAEALAISPDGMNLYVNGYGKVHAYARSSSTGHITLTQTLIDDVGGVDGIGSPRDVVVSPDGAHVYFVSTHEDAVAIFSRNSTDGTLSYVGMVQDGVGGVDGLDHPLGVTVSPDGKHVYAVGFLDSAVAVFERSATTGALTFVEVEKNGVNGVADLIPRGVTISPDGNYVYAPGDSRLSVFRRNPTTGALTFVGSERNTAGVLGIYGILAAVVAPNGRDVYVSADQDNSINLFHKHTTTLTVTKQVAGQIPPIPWVFDGSDGMDAFEIAASGGTRSFVLDKGTYAITETVRTGYVASSNCSNGTIGTSTLSLALDWDTPVTCSFTNTAQPATLIINKTLVGSKPDTDWQFSGSSGIGSFTLPAAGGSQTFSPLSAGTYTVSEATQTGYTASLSCTDGTSGTSSATVDLAPGETVTCNFTNTAQPRTLIITKTVVGAVPNEDWHFTGTKANFYLPAAGGTHTIMGWDVSSGSMCESSMDGYSNSISCTNGKSGVNCVGLSMEPGETVGCTFTNTAQPATLIITKTVVGAIPGSAWQFTGSGSIGSFTLPAAGGSKTLSSLSAGSYTVDETTKPGYSTSVSCTNGSSGGSGVTLDLAPGQTVGCTFTNTAQPATLIITKTVAGATPGSTWQFTGSGSIGSFTLPAAGGSKTLSLDTATYTVSETGKAGYTAAVSCTDGSSGGSSATIFLGPGETAGCTFTNTETQPGNSAPYFTSAAILVATQDLPYTYTVTAEDPDAGDTLTIDAPMLPGWLGLVDNGDGTAVVSGTPAGADVGTHGVALLVTDTAGASGSQSFTITVAAASTATGTVEGVLFDDTNGNGVQDPGEPGLPGATVTLTDETGAAALRRMQYYATTTTDAYGYYRFTNVPVGSYALTVEPPADCTMMGKSTFRLTVSEGSICEAPPAAAVPNTRYTYLPTVQRRATASAASDSDAKMDIYIPSMVR